MLLYDKTTSVLILQSCHLLGAIVRAIGMHQYRLQSLAKGLQRPVRGFSCGQGCRAVLLLKSAWRSAIIAKTAAARYLLRGGALQARTQCACYASKPVTKCIASEELSPYAWSASVLGGRFVYDCKIF